MQDYTIGENYSLPSKGLVYDFDVDPHVKLRSMTTNEEMRRVASIDRPYQNLSEIIDACMVEGPGISAYDMCIGDYQYLLHKLRIVTYGPEYKVVNKCIYCGTSSEDTINLEDLNILEYSEDFEKYREFDLPKSGKHIRLHVQTPRMLDNISERTKEYKRKAKGNIDYDPSLIFLIAELIESIDGKRPNPVTIEDWVKELPMADANTIIQYAEKMNESIGIDSTITCICDICGLEYNALLKTTNEFFRPTLSI